MDPSWGWIKIQRNKIEIKMIDFLSKFNFMIKIQICNILINNINHRWRYYIPILLAKSVHVFYYAKTVLTYKRRQQCAAGAKQF